MSKPRVLIADDQTLFRSGVAWLLRGDSRIEVVGEAADGAEAIEMVKSLKPDVVLMDLKMPNVDGVEATREICRVCPETKVLVLSTFDGEDYVIPALKSGASGYVLKDSEPSAIVTSLLAVASGERVMAGGVADRILEMATGSGSQKKQYDSLTAREVEILKLVAIGMANKEIAYRLKVSEKTVRNHVSNMYEKLGINDRAQAVLYAVRNELVQL